MNERGPEMPNPETTIKRIVDLMNDKVPPELWFDPDIMSKDILVEGFRAYLGAQNGNGMSREDKVKMARFVIVHGLPESAGISFEDVGISKEEIDKIFAESEIRVAESMLTRLRIDSKRPGKDFMAISPDVLEWASGANKVKAIREMLEKNDLSPETIGTTNGELDELAKWKANPPQPELN
ncbi:MAG TPA: hypothetical protein VFT82_04340 [Candidatus Paceibacterota bacterium]|nr:hypothetical protein [Candidatus Paceibacterota bacterium]